MSAIADVIAGLSPLDGAVEFLDALRARTQVILLSDTFAEFARPLMAQLGWPTIFCHRLDVVDDRIVGYRLRMPDQKRHAVVAFQGLGYRVVAAGDSYNDTSMLLAADAGFLFHAPANVRSPSSPSSPPTTPTTSSPPPSPPPAPPRSECRRASEHRTAPPPAPTLARDRGCHRRRRPYRGSTPTRGGAVR